MSHKVVIVEVKLVVDESVDAEDLVVNCDYEFGDFENRIEATQIAGYVERNRDGKITKMWRNYEN